MSLSILALGKLASDPEKRISQSGKPFCKLRLSVSDGDQSVLLSCVAFSETAISALERLGKGDSIAVTGRGKPTAWQKGDSLHSGLDVVVDAVLTPYQVSKRRGKGDSQPQAGNRPHGAANARVGEPGAYRAAAMAQRSGDELRDDLPW